MNAHLTEKQIRFCNEYIKDFNATRSYKAAYPGCKKDETAAQAGSRMLRNVKVKEYIEQLKEELKATGKITQEMIMAELAKIGFSDIRKLYNENGGLKNIHEIDDNTAAAISGIETFQEFEGYGEDREYIGDTKKIKLYSKDKALELLGKQIGMFKDKVEINNDKPFEVNINVINKKDK